MDSLAVQVVLVLVLVGVNGMLAGSEMALVTLRDSQLRQLQQSGPRGRRLRRLVEDPNRFLSTIQIGITLAGFLASAAAAVVFAEPLVPFLAFLGAAAEPVAVVLVTLVLTYLTLVLGELAPKRIAMQRAERWGLVAATPLSAFASAARPAVWFLSASSNVVVRLAGVDPKAEPEPLSEEELRDIVAHQASLSPLERRIVAGALEFGDRTLREVLRPRTKVYSLPADIDASSGLQALLASGHSRAPVFGADEADDLVGIVHLRDLIRAGGLVREHTHPALVFAETLGALEALRRLQVEHQQMAVVLNEHLSVEGIVTVEDLLEEVVGEIYDEVDRDVLTARIAPDGSVAIPGWFPMHDLSDVGVDLPAGPYATIAGLVLDKLEELPPAVGDVVEVGEWRIEVTAVRRLAVTRVRLTRSAVR